MYRQGNFVAQEGGFPDEVLADLDNTVGVFPMPGQTAEDKPVLGGGDLAGIFSQDNEAAQELVAVPGVVGVRDERSTAQTATGSRRAPTSTSACTRTRPSQAIATVAYESTDFVFDGSDQMPGEVGLRFVLAGDDRVDQRRGGRQDGAGQHREQLAGLTG